MSKFNRFGNMSPPKELLKKSYKLSVKPIKITDNLYYVGNRACSSHLIDTGDGLILLDTPLITEFAYLIDSIWSLGFNPRDIKYIVISHAHADHYACVNALAHITKAKTFLGKFDAKWMRDNPDVFINMRSGFGGFIEEFTPDVELEDGETIVLGNTKIKCIHTPGHTIGTMSHFWDTTYHNKTYKVGIYGGSGFWVLRDEELKANKMSKELVNSFVESIDKVFDKHVDIMLGNHPFHNDTFYKRDILLKDNENAFIDQTEWKVFLKELRSKYEEFLEMSDNEKGKLMEYSLFREYHKI